MSEVFGNEESGFTANFGAERSSIMNYETAINKPQIEGQELVGNKTAEDLGLAKAADIPDNVSELNNDAGYQTASEVNDSILSNGIAINKTSHPIGVGINDLASNDVYNNMRFAMALATEKSGTPSLSNPIEVLAYDEFIVRQYKKPTNGALNIGVASASDALYKYEGIAPDSNGVISENASYNTYAIPLIANANYKVCGSLIGGTVYAFMANSMPSIGDSVSLISLAQFDSTSINAGNNKFLFFACQSSESNFAVEPFDLVGSSSIYPWSEVPVYYNDLRISCRINADGGAYPVQIADVDFEKTPTSTSTNVEFIYFDLSNMDVVTSANSSGVFMLGVKGNLKIDSNVAGDSNKLQFVDNASNYDESFSFRIDGANINVHISECANMNKTQLEEYLSTAGIKIAFAPDWDASSDAEIIVTDNLTFEEYDYYCIGNRITNITSRVNFTQTPKKLISLIPNKANTSDVVPMPTKPTSNGTYTLKCTKSGSTFTYSWVKDT